MASTSMDTSSNKEPTNQLKQDNPYAIEQKYSPDEIDAAYALLALSNSAPASPPGYKAVVNEPGAQDQPGNIANDDKQPNASEVTTQASLQTPAIQVSPLEELNSFVAAALPGGDKRYAYNNYAASQLRDFTVWKCENHGCWACQQCFHAVNP